MSKIFYRDPDPVFKYAFDQQDLLAANRRHDSEKHTVSMDTRVKYPAVNPDRFVLIVRRVK